MVTEMSNSPNRFLDDPKLYTLESNVVTSLPLQFGGHLVAADQTIFRAAGGGQPEDHGGIEIGGRSYPVSEVRKLNGKTYVAVPGLVSPPNRGDKMVQTIDLHRRDQLSRLHTLQHLVSAAAYRHVPGFKPAGTGIDDDQMVAWTRFNCIGDAYDREFLIIDQTVRSWVLSDLEIEQRRFKSVSHAEFAYPETFRLDASVKLTGKVRMIVIDTVDCNPCAGTHWYSSNIGAYEMKVSPIELDGIPSVELRANLSPTWMYWFCDQK